MSRIATHFLVAALLQTVLLAKASEPQDRQWTWEIRSVTDSNSILIIGDEKLSLLSTDIPISRIAGITYDRALHNRAALLFKAVAGSEASLLLLPPYGTGLLLVLATSKQKDHLITVAFANPEGQQQELTFRADKSNYKDILEELSSVTGKRWRDLYTEREDLRKWLKQAPRNAEPLRIDRPVTFGGIRLTPGIYSIAAWQHQDALGQVFLFRRGQSAPLAWDTAQIEERGSSTRSGEAAVYTADANGSTVTEIFTPRTHIHIVPRQILGDPAASLR